MELENSGKACTLSYVGKKNMLNSYPHGATTEVAVSCPEITMRGYSYTNEEEDAEQSLKLV